MWNLLLTSQRTSLIVYVKPITQSAIECQSTRERGNGFPSAAESAPARRIPNKAQMLKFWKKTYVLLSCEIRSDFSRREIFELVSTRVDVIEFLRGAPPPPLPFGEPGPCCHYWSLRSSQVNGRIGVKRFSNMFFLSRNGLPRWAFGRKVVCRLPHCIASLLFCELWLRSQHLLHWPPRVPFSAKEIVERYKCFFSSSSWPFLMSEGPHGGWNPKKPTVRTLTPLGRPRCYPALNGGSCPATRCGAALGTVAPFPSVPRERSILDCFGRFFKLGWFSGWIVWSVLWYCKRSSSGWRSSLANWRSVHLRNWTLRLKLIQNGHSFRWSTLFFCRWETS